MIQFSKIKYIIFDLDGVIVNSEFLHYEAYRRAFIKNGLRLSIDDYNGKLRSKGRKEGLRALIKENKDFLIEDISISKDQMFIQILENETIEVYDDAVNLIKICKKRNLPIAIGTASKMGAQVLEKIGLKSLFDVIITSQDVVKNKPNPEIYIKCQKQLNADADKTIVIEDSEPGIIAALNAQLKVVSIKRNNAPPISDVYLNNENVFVCNNLDIISKWINP